MAAIAAHLTGRVLVQFGDGEPVEIGTIEVPIHVSTSHLVSTREAEPHTVTRERARDILGLAEPRQQREMRGRG